MLTPAELETLARKHGATSYRNRADTAHPAYGFSEAGLQALIAEAQAATLATVTPLVQQMLEAMRSCVWLTDREIVEQSFDEDKVDDACKAARAFLSGATKESTDHG